MSGFRGDRFRMHGPVMSRLGKGLPGGQPPGGLLNGGPGPGGSGGMEGGSGRSRTRRVLREAFGNHRLPFLHERGCRGEAAAVCATGDCPPADGVTRKKIPLTPFRAAFTAGDPVQSNFGRSSAPTTCLYSPNQVTGTNRSLTFQRARHMSNGVSTVSHGAQWTGNAKFVYDSSDYIKFKKLQASNRNYNDRSFGGDQNNASYVPRQAVRRF